MELKDIRYFLAVADTLNFSRAAESLYISQPALSQKIAELEKELGAELFTRGNRCATLTPTGEAILEPARMLLRQTDEIPHIFSSNLKPLVGDLRIGFDDTEDHFEQIGVTQAIADFTRANPAVNLSLEKNDFTLCTEKLIYGGLDLAFLILRHKERLPPQLASRTISRSKLVMVVAEQSPAITYLDAVNMHELILVDDKPRGNSRILKVLKDMGVSPKIRSVDSMTSGFVYAQLGCGIMLMSEVYFRSHNYAGLRAIDLDLKEADLTHKVVWNQTTQNPVISQILAQFPEV